VKRLMSTTALLGLTVAPIMGLAQMSDNPTGFYAGAGLGRFNLKVRSLDAVGDALSSIAHSNNDSWKVFGGYRTSPYLSFEAAYVDFGRSKDGFTATGSNGNYRIKVSGVAPSVLVTAPLGPVEVFGKASYYFYDIDTRVNFDSPAPGTSAGVDSKHSDSKFALGGGVGLTFAERFNVRAEYEVLKVRNARNSGVVWLTGSIRL
jgi:OmpA-OmpF porin, OOP family